MKLSSVRLRLPRRVVRLEWGLFAVAVLLVVFGVVVWQKQLSFGPGINGTTPTPEPTISQTEQPPIVDDVLSRPEGNRNVSLGVPGSSLQYVVLQTTAVGHGDVATEVENRIGVVSLSDNSFKPIKLPFINTTLTSANAAMSEDGKSIAISHDDSIWLYQSSGLLRGNYYYTLKEPGFIIGSMRLCRDGSQLAYTMFKRIYSEEQENPPPNNVYVLKVFGTATHERREILRYEGGYGIEVFGVTSSEVFWQYGGDGGGLYNIHATNLITNHNKIIYDKLNGYSAFGGPVFLDDFTKLLTVGYSDESATNSDKFDGIYVWNQDNTKSLLYSMTDVADRYYETDKQLSYNPERNRLVVEEFNSCESDELECARISVVDLQAKTRRTLAVTTGLRMDTVGPISPDGQYIFMSNYTNTSSEVWSLTDGTVVSQPFQSRLPDQWTTFVGWLP